MASFTEHNINDQSASSFRIRPCVPDDCDEVMRLIKELACFEKLEQQVHITADHLREDGFGPTAYFRCLVAELTKPVSQPINTSVVTQFNPLVGYMLFFNKYSTWEGRSLYMEDLYVTPDHRKQRIGLAFTNALAKLAIAEGCRRIDFSVLGWNKSAIEFYKKMNAVDLTELEDWHYFRISGDNIQKLADCDVFKKDY